MATWGSAAFLLLVPLIAMQFTEEMAWGPGDFVLLGAMLFGACGTYELAARMTGDGSYRAAVAVAVAAAFLIVWVNLAVGIIGSEDNRANLMFAGVLAIALIGAVVARFQPQGMARALVATAIAQALVAVVALVMGSLEGFVLSGFFVASWLLSAWLFRKAQRGQSPQVARSHAA